MISSVWASKDMHMNVPNNPNLETIQMSINCKTDTNHSIFVKGISVHQWKGQGHRWISQSKCGGKEARHKRTHFVWFNLHKVQNSAKVVKANLWR